MIALKVLIEDVWHTVQTGESGFTQNIINPAFSDDAIWTTHSYPFTVPNTGVNETLFEFISNAASIKPFSELKNIRCVVYDDDIPVVYGTLEVTEVSTATIEVVVSANSNVLVEIKDKKLNEIDMGGLRNDVANAQQSIYFYINGDAFVTGDIGLYIGTTHVYVPILTTLENAAIALAAAINTADLGVTASYKGYDAPHDGWTIWIIADWAGSYPILDASPGSHGTRGQWFWEWGAGTSYAVTQVEWFAFMNTVMLGTADDYDMAFFPVKNYGSSIVDPNDTANTLAEFWQNPFIRSPYGMFKLNITDEEEKFVACVTPFVYVRYVLEQILAHIGATWDYMSEDVDGFDYITKRLCLYNNVSVEAAEYDPESYYENKQSIIGDKYNLANHVPTRTVSEMVNAFLKVFNGALFFNSITNKFRFVLRNKILASTDYKDLSAFADPFIIIRPLYNFNSYKAGYNWDGSDSYPNERVRSIDGWDIVTIVNEGDMPVKFAEKTIFWVSSGNYYIIPKLAWPPGPLTNQFFSVDNTEWVSSSDKEQYEVQPECDAPIMFRDFGGPYTDDPPIVHPRVSVPIVSHASSQPADVVAPPNDIGIRFMLYHGVVSDPDFINDFPLGGSDEYDTYFNEIGDFSLVWNRPSNNAKCLWPKFHADWYDFIKQSKEIEMKFNLNTLQIRELNLEQKVMVHNVLYLIKEIQVEYPIRKSVTIKLVRI